MKTVGKTKKKILYLVMFIMVFVQVNSSSMGKVNAENIAPGVKYGAFFYQGQSQKYALHNTNKLEYENNQTAGEGYYNLTEIGIMPTDMDQTISYRVYIEGEGWSKIAKYGEVLGNYKKNILDIQIMSDKYDVVYQILTGENWTNARWSKPMLTETMNQFPSKTNQYPIKAIKIKVEPKRHALCILGTNKPERDVTTMEKAFQRNHITTSVNENVTTGNIDNVIRNEFKNSKQNSVNYLYITAHGQDPAKSDDFQFALGNKMMSFRKLIGILNQIRGRKVIMIEACYAGKAVELFQEHSNLFGKNKDDYQIIAATQKDKVSYYLGTSFATYVWQAAMGINTRTGGKGQYLSDYNGDGFILMNEFYNYSETELTNMTAKLGDDTHQSTSCYNINDTDPEHALFIDYEIH